MMTTNDVSASGHDVGEPESFEAFILRCPEDVLRQIVAFAGKQWKFKRLADFHCFLFQVFLLSLLSHLQIKISFILHLT